MPSATTVRKARFPRKLKLALVALGVGAALVWLFGNGWVAGRFEKAMVDGLDKQGLALTWKTSSWDPWRGLHLTGLKLSQRDGGGAMLAEMDNLNLSLPLAQAFSKENRMTRWKVGGSDVILHDKEGAVKLKNVSLNLEAKSGKVEIKRFRSTGKGLSVDVDGTILFTTPGKPRTSLFELRLDALRATFATLDFKQEEGRFKVTGNFTVDRRDGETHWKANLKGEGQDLDWKGVEWKKGSAQAVLSSGDSTIEYELQTANGMTRGTVSKNDWQKSPFIFKGELRDKEDKVDSYRGNYQDRVFTLEHLEGPADLIALSRDVHALKDAAPENLKFQTFPTVEVKNLVRSAAGEEPAWKVASLQIRSKDKVTFTFDGREAEALGLSVHAAHDGKDWIIKDATAGVLGGRVSVEGRLRGKVLQGSRVEASDIRLGELKQLTGGKRRSSAGIVSGAYRGRIDFEKSRLDGSGSVRLDNAPILEVPLLDQVYDLFNALIPGVKRSNEGRFEADYKADGTIMDVTRFEATGGSLTVSAVGKVNLEKRTVSGRARGKLTGLPGLVTSPLSRLLEMDVGGPYNNIRVKPLGPAKLASNTASGTVGVVVDTIEETGKITGTVLTEGVKLPFRLLQKDKEEKKEN